MANLQRFSSTAIQRNQSGKSGVMVDKDLQELIAKMNKSTQNLKDSSKLLRKILGLPANRARNFFAKTLSKVIPNALREYVPNGMAVFISEELDVLDFTENRLRQNTDEAQLTAGDMALTAIDQKDQLEKARAELAKAKNEDWDAKELRAYLSEKVGIEIDPNIERLLDARYDYLSAEEKQRRKNNLLKRLDIGLNNRGELCGAIARACAIQLDTLDELVLTLHEFVHIHRPLEVLRNAGMTMNENARAILASSAVVQDTFERLLQTFENIIEVASMYEKHAISSTAMNARFVNGRKRLEAGLVKLEQSRDKIKLLPVRNEPITQISTSTEKTAEAS